MNGLLENLTINNMWIQSTRDITREEAIEKALDVYKETWRIFLSAQTDEFLENYIDEYFFNYNIINK